MLGLGRIPHLAFDLIAISTILAGIRRSSGFAFDMEHIHGTTIRALLKSYFGLGETIYTMINTFVCNSRYFKRTLK